MSFNFASFADTKPASNNSYLKPYSINENVTIKSTEISEGTNATTGNAWKCLKITFGNNEGTYTESIFYLTDPTKDNARGEMTMSNGGKRELPSNWERTRDKMAAIGYAFFPESFEKFKAVAPKAKTFEEMMGFYKKIVDSAIDKKATNMKLVGRNSGGRVYATLPSCTGIAQAKDEKTALNNKCNVGDWYTWVSSPFNDNLDKLSFSAYEDSQRNAISAAKPTAMPDELPEIKDEDPFDLESLL